jgi:hypothetical protein
VTGQRFDGVVQSMNGGRGHAVALPFDPKAVFGKARAPVRVTVPDHEPFRTTVAVYGGVGWIGLRKDQLVAFGLELGEPVTMLVELDDSPREVEVPAELTEALAGDTQARERFAALSFTHRKEYASWVDSAVKEQTRQTRAAKAVTMLRDGVRTPDGGGAR